MINDATNANRLGEMATEFSTFILSLGSSVMYHLGEQVVDGMEPEAANLPLARHTIDILCMLRTKTQGNLSDHEAELLETLLYDLRMRYIKRTKGASAEL